jgi:hypothetical protein
MGAPHYRSAVTQGVARMKRFGALRFIAGLYRVLAWVFLIAGLIGSVAIVVVLVMGGRINTPLAAGLIDTASLPGAIAGALLLGSLSLMLYLTLNAAADGIAVVLAIEENTAAMAALLKGETQPGQTDAPWSDTRY